MYNNGYKEYTIFAATYDQDLIIFDFNFDIKTKKEIAVYRLKENKLYDFGKEILNVLMNTTYKEEKDKILSVINDKEAVINAVEFWQGSFDLSEEININFDFEIDGEYFRVEYLSDVSYLVNYLKMKGLFDKLFEEVTSFDYLKKVLLDGINVYVYTYKDKISIPLTIMFLYDKNWIHLFVDIVKVPENQYGRDFKVELNLNNISFRYYYNYKYRGNGEIDWYKNLKRKKVRANLFDMIFETSNVYWHLWNKVEYLRALEIFADEMLTKYLSFRIKNKIYFISRWYGRIYIRIYDDNTYKLIKKYQIGYADYETFKFDWKNKIKPVIKKSIPLAIRLKFNTLYRYIKFINSKL